MCVRFCVFVLWSPLGRCEVNPGERSHHSFLIHFTLPPSLKSVKPPPPKNAPLKLDANEVSSGFPRRTLRNWLAWGNLWGCMWERMSVCWVNGPGQHCFSLINLSKCSVYNSEEKLAFRKTESLLMTGGLLLTLYLHMKQIEPNSNLFPECKREAK